MPPKKPPDSIKVKIPEELVITEKKRCSAFKGDEDKCKSNKCFYKRKGKKCDIHYKIFSENMNKSKESRRKSSMSSRKKSKRSNKSKRKSKSKKRIKSKRKSRR